MGSAEDARRADTMRIMGEYQAFLSQGRFDDWIELWAEDGELAFPYGPAGRRRIYRGKPEILAYMKHATGRVSADSVEQMRVSPMLDPGMAVVELSFKGRVLADNAPYNQSLVIFFEVEDGKLRRYREYWNPLITIDAMGGRDKWTNGFGTAEDTAA